MSKDFRFLMYHSDEGDVSVNAVVQDETVWLTQKGMAELFDCTTDNNQHLIHRMMVYLYLRPRFHAVDKALHFIIQRWVKIVVLPQS